MGKFKYEVYDYSKVGICKPTKFSSVWSTETLSNINAYYNVDAERELTRILSEQIAADVDRQIATMLTGNFTSTGPTYAPTYISNSTDFFNAYNG